MKKLLLIFAIALVSCSKDDDDNYWEKLDRYNQKQKIEQKKDSCFQIN